MTDGFLAVATVEPYELKGDRRIVMDWFPGTYGFVANTVTFNGRKCELPYPGIQRCIPKMEIEDGKYYYKNFLWLNLEDEKRLHVDIGSSLRFVAEKLNKKQADKIYRLPDIATTKVYDNTIGTNGIHSKETASYMKGTEFLENFAESLYTLKLRLNSDYFLIVEYGNGFKTSHRQNPD